MASSRTQQGEPRLRLVVVDCPFGRGEPGDVAYWLWRALKAATRAATTSLRRISSVVGRMLPTAGMRRRTPIIPAQVIRMCRGGGGCRPPHRTGDTGRHRWRIVEMPGGAFRLVTAQLKA